MQSNYGMAIDLGVFASGNIRQLEINVDFAVAWQRKIEGARHQFAPVKTETDNTRSGFNEIFRILDLVAITPG